MKYEVPELIGLLPAINLIQATMFGKSSHQNVVEFAQPGSKNEPSIGYVDWED